jgi:predicted amidohydrolase YtcJ
MKVHAQSLLTVTLLVAGSALAGEKAKKPQADEIYFGGPIVTMNDAQRSAEAVAIRQGKIIAVGSHGEVKRLAGPKTRHTHLQGKTLIPGFVDGHGHLFSVGVQAIAANLLPPPDGKVDSMTALKSTLRDWMRTSAVPGKLHLIVGFGYDDSQLKEKRHPTKQDLDEVSRDLPIILIHQSGHIQAYNSKALALAGIDASTPDPKGGKFRRMPGTQEPNGVAEERAAFEVLAKVLPKLDPKDMQALIEAGQDLYTRYGHTTAQEGAAVPGAVKALEAAAEKGVLKVDVVTYPIIQTVGDGSLMKTPYAGRNYRNHLRLGGVKLVLDGSPQGKTAWLTKPYLVPPDGQKPDYAGYPSVTDEEATAFVSEAFANDWQILAHTNGDAAIDQYLKAVREASRKLPAQDRRPVMIHGQTLRADQIPALKELGIFPSLFPMHTYYWGDWHRDSVLGLERAQNISPTGWVLRAGMKFSSHHDAPVAFPDTLRVLSATVNRTTRSGQVLGPDQRVEPWEALKAMTLWPAYQYFEENRKGSIEVGKVADFAILSDNPLTIEKSRIADIQVLKTIKGGQVIYARNDPPHSPTAGAGTAPGQSCIRSARCFEKLAEYRMHHPLYEDMAATPHRHP